MHVTGTEHVQGDGLRLRPIAEADAGLIVEASAGDVPDWTFVPRDLDEEGARQWIRRGFRARESGRALRFVIEVEERLAGIVGAQHPQDHDRGVLETFYFVLPGFRRRGLATAGLRLLNAWARSVTPELRRLQLHVIVGNPGSGRVAELAGYRFEGVAAHRIPPVNGFGPRDAEVYGMAVFGSGRPAGDGLLSGCAQAPDAPGPPRSAVLERVDHLVHAVEDLEAGRDEIERLLGVRPVLGGRHPEYGTHNALVALGPATYLEIIAPDPTLDAPERGVLFGADGVRGSKLVTWALRSESIEKAAASASSAGFALGPIESGSRVKPDGAVIAWKLSDPYAMPLGGAVPFLIGWGDTPHPAGAAPRAGDLVGLRIEHPDPERVREALSALSAELDVRSGEEFRLIARIGTARGTVEIR